MFSTRCAVAIVAVAVVACADPVFVVEEEHGTIVFDGAPSVSLGPVDAPSHGAGERGLRLSAGLEIQGSVAQRFDSAAPVPCSTPFSSLSWDAEALLAATASTRSPSLGAALTGDGGFRLSQSGTHTTSEPILLFPIAYLRQRRRLDLRVFLELHKDGDFQIAPSNLVVGLSSAASARLAVVPARTNQSSPVNGTSMFLEAATSGPGQFNTANSFDADFSTLRGGSPSFSVAMSVDAGGRMSASLSDGLDRQARLSQTASASPVVAAPDGSELLSLYVGFAPSQASATQQTVTIRSLAFTAAWSCPRQRTTLGARLTGAEMLAALAAGKATNPSGTNLTLASNGESVIIGPTSSDVAPFLGLYFRSPIGQFRDLPQPLGLPDQPLVHCMVKFDFAPRVELSDWEYRIGIAFGGKPIFVGVGDTHLSYNLNRYSFQNNSVVADQPSAGALTLATSVQLPRSPTTVFFTIGTAFVRVLLVTPERTEASHHRVDQFLTIAPGADIELVMAADHVHEINLLHSVEYSVSWDAIPDFGRI